MFTISVFDTKPYDRDFLQSASGKDMEWRFHDFRLQADTVRAAEGSQAVSLFVNDRADRECLQELASLGIKLIAMRCAGYNNIDLETAKNLGIHAVRVPAYSPHAVAEHAIGLLLTLNRKIHRAYNRVREWNFSLSGLIGFDIAGKTVGIIGTGRIGRITAQIFRGFESRVIAYDVEPDLDWAKTHQVDYHEFEKILHESDIISLHVPLLPTTHHLINKEALQQMRKGAYLINTSRGKVIESKALIEALKEGKLGGVALDTYEEEEGVFFEDLSNQVLLDDELSRLLSFPNVLVTSHQGFFTREALENIAQITVDNLLRFKRGEPLKEETVLA
jgi:D-lactate dehydrogenase